MPTENDIDKIKKDLASLRAASDLAKKSAQTASRQIKEVEGKDFGKLFDKQFKSFTNRAARSLDGALQSLIVEGDSFKTVFKKLGADLLKNVLSSLPHGNIASSILPFARGGVLNSPALFPFKARHRSRRRSRARGDLAARARRRWQAGRARSASRRAGRSGQREYHNARCSKFSPHPNTDRRHAAPGCPARTA